MHPAGNNISPYSVNFIELIGEGSFGKVFKAGYQDRNGSKYHVAVKILDRNSRDDVLAEKNRLASLDHDNVLKLIGIVLHPIDSEDEIPYLVLEYMPNGDLQNYLNDYYTNAAQRISWAFEIACGMDYLHDGEMIHGDLAARNCLLDGNLKIKIGDFGRLDDDNNDEYYTSYDGEDWDIPCPIRWMAPENFESLVLYSDGSYYEGKPNFSYKGDVWAFGVILYEMWSAGKVPYDGLNNTDVMRAVQANCGPAYYDDKFTARRHIISLMDWCMDMDPDDRPTFEEIMDDLKENERHVLRNY